MGDLIKSDLYRMIYKKENIILILVSVTLCELIAIYKAIQDVYTFEKICSESGKIIIYPMVIAISGMVYYLLNDYFEADFYSCECFMGYNLKKIFFSKYIVITLYVGVVYVALPILTVYFFEFYKIKIYDDLLVRGVTFFLLISRVFFDSVVIIYISNNFFLYMGIICSVWFVIPDLIKKSTILNVQLYVYSWKYQMGLIALSGVTKDMLLKYVIPYEFACFFIHMTIMSGILYLTKRVKK